MAARQGQSFSQGHQLLQAGKALLHVPDLYAPGFFFPDAKDGNKLDTWCYSDGIGLVGALVAAKMARQAGLPHGYVPSAFQVGLCGSLGG